MKKTLGILTLIVILILAYSIFIDEKSEYVAGEYRYYTIYEKYKSKEKEIDFAANSYENDKYNLKGLKDDILERIKIIDEYRQRMNLYYDSINSKTNTISDYNSYIKSLEELKSDLENQKDYIKGYKNDLVDLNEFISKFERGLISIKMYNSDISNVYSALNSIDSTVNGYTFSADLIILSAASKGLDLAKEIEKQREIERQEFLAQIERERELEQQKRSYSSNNSYYSKTYISDYNTYSTENTYIPPPTYNSIPNVSSYTIPDFPTSFYSTNTNPNHVQVDGYYKSNGTYVEPYMRTAPNSTIKDNFSTSPNLNPYTGEIGTIKYKN